MIFGARATVALLKARLTDLETQLVASRDEVKYWRARYERVADALLFRQGDIVAPLHVEEVKTQPVANRVMRAASLVGNSTGIRFDKTASHGSAAELPIELVPNR